MTPEQINLTINHMEKAITELNYITSNIQTRKDQFIQQYENKTKDTQSDLIILSISELKTKITVLSKMHAEIVNVDSAILHEAKNADKEIMRRQ